MAKLNAKVKIDSEPNSAALKHFELNLDGVALFINETGTRHLQRRLSSLRQFVKREIKAGVIVGATRLTDSISSLGSELEKDVRMIHFRSEWVGVMLITFLIAYLKECLILLAEKNSKLLKDLPAFDSWRLLFEMNSIDEVRDEIKKVWAERFLQGTGPEGWSKRLTVLGVRGYERADIFAMQHLFDTRNCIIHDNGIATTNYVKRYPTQRLEGGRIRIAMSELTMWLAATAKFVKTTDAFLLKYGSTT